MGESPRTYLKARVGKRNIAESKATPSEKLMCTRRKTQRYIYMKAAMSDSRRDNEKKQSTSFMGGSLLSRRVVCIARDRERERETHTHSEQEKTHEELFD